MKRFCLAALLALTTGAAHAQIDTGAFPIDMVSPVVPQMMLENVLESPGAARRGNVARAPAPGLRALAPTGAATATSVRAVATTYRASPAVNARVKQQYVDHIRKTVGPQGAQQYSQVLSRNDFVRNWSQLVSEEGFRPGDVAEALASYWMLNYLMANNLVDAPPGMGKAVARQVRGIMGSNPAFTRLNEPQRQEMAEVYMLNFLTQQAAYSNAVKAGDKTMQKRLGQAAVTRFRNEMGLDLRQVALTETGFVRRS